MRVPVGEDAHRWRTFPGERTLVVAARTLTSTIRILEVLPALLRGDARITVVFAHDPGSAFSDGSMDLLHDSGCRVMPWEQLSYVEPDLILSASEHIDLPAGHCPVLVLPHGVGFQKYVPDSRASRERLSGVVPDELLEAGRAWLAVSHPEQERQLTAAHPKTAGRTLLVGDPCLDELLVSEDRRKDYRDALGIQDNQRLVMVSSTWGPTSLIARNPELPARLLGQLPWDTHRVGLILHPNVWSAHGAWHIRTLQAAALDAGLLLMPPVHDWRPALVAADAVIGDHGSVTLYGAALGRPTALAAHGSEAVPGTASADLARIAPRLDPAGGLLAQVDGLMRDHAGRRHDPYADVVARAFEPPGTALARLREAVYDLLRLPLPATEAPRPRALTTPADPATPVTSWIVGTRLDADAATETETETTPPGLLTIDVSRFPSSVGRERPETEHSFWHRAVKPAEERDRRLSENASVLLGSAPAPDLAAARHWARDTLARWPGSLLAANGVSSGVCLVSLRDGSAVEVSSTGAPAPGTAPGTGTDPALAASAVYACLRTGIPPYGIEAALRLDGAAADGREIRLRLRPAVP
ncbi:hypothetical protein CP970_28440 [Streptomyces kanamyceticus]|uniref:Translation initiation factor 2 n=1 Tax=Streptomyces kanamyceticus TaxID=1967 RepID=A0A5J6GTR0_STRKN|nr:hypothetical protein CP970_28440 [Streptomyces kanamyceticus]